MKTKNSFADAKVNEVMTRRVHSLMQNDTIQDAVALMLDNRLSAIPVVDSGNHCIGIISRADLTEVFLQEDQELSRESENDRLSLEWINRSLDTCDVRMVKELMTYEVTQIQEDQSLPEACKEMVKKRIHHLPVVNSENVVVGFLSSFDVVKAVSEHE